MGLVIHVLPAGRLLCVVSSLAVALTCMPSVCLVRLYQSCMVVLVAYYSFDRCYLGNQKSAQMHEKLEVVYRRVGSFLDGFNF